MQRDNEVSVTVPPSSDYTHNLLSRTVSSASVATSVGGVGGGFVGAVAPINSYNNNDDCDDASAAAVARGIVGGSNISTIAVQLTVNIPSVDSMPILSLPPTTTTSPVPEEDDRADGDYDDEEPAHGVDGEDDVTPPHPPLPVAIVPEKKSISTIAMVRKYKSAVHIPTFVFENARCIGVTIIPLLAHAVCDGSYLSEIGANSLSSMTSTNNNITPTNNLVPTHVLSTNTTGTTPSKSAGGDAGDQLMGLLLALISLGTVVGNIPSGMLAHRLPLRFVLSLTGATYITATIALVLTMYFGSYSAVYAVLIMSSFLWGVGFSPLSVGRLLFVQHSVPKEWRPRLMSTVGGVQRWAMVSGPFITGLVTDYVPGGYATALALHVPLMIAYILLISNSKMLKKTGEELEAERRFIAASVVTSSSPAAAAPGVADYSAALPHSRDNLIGSDDASNSNYGIGDEDESARTSSMSTRYDSPSRLSSFIIGNRYSPVSRVERDDTKGYDAIYDDEDAGKTPLRNADVDGPRKREQYSINVDEEQYADLYNNNNAISTIPQQRPTTTTSAASATSHQPTAHQPPSGLRIAIEEIRQNLYVVLVVGTFSFIMQMMRVNRTMLITVRALHMGLAPSVIGTVLSASFLVDATLFLLGGYVGDKFGMRFQTAAASACLGLSFIALSIPGATTSTSALIQLVLSSLLFGVANSIGAGLLLSLVATHAPKSKGNGVLTVMRSMQDAGPLVGSLGAGFLLRYVSFEYTCLLFGIVGLANAIFGAVMIPQTRRGG